jgi:pantothenate kinase
LSLVVSVDASGLAAWIAERATGAHRFLFGIAGPPGSGKSTLAAALADELGAPVVPMDGFHVANAMLAERGLRDRKGAPETFAAEAFVDLVRRLRVVSDVVECPTFDRTVDEPVAGGLVVTPGDVIVVVEGNYLLLDEPPWTGLGELFDVIAYVEVPDDVRIGRLIERHVAFGRDRSDAIDFVGSSDEANARRVAPGRNRADVLISFAGPSEGSPPVQRVEWSIVDGPG